MPNPSEFLDDSTFVKVRNNLNVFCFILLTIWFLGIPYPDIGLLGFKPFKNVELIRIEIILGVVFVYLFLRYYQDLRIERYNLNKNAAPKNNAGQYLFEKFKDTYSNFFFHHISRNILPKNFVVLRIHIIENGIGRDLDINTVPSILAGNIFFSIKRFDEGFLFNKIRNVEDGVRENINGVYDYRIGEASSMVIAEGYSHFVDFYRKESVITVFFKPYQYRLVTFIFYCGYPWFYILRPQGSKLYLPLILSLTLMATRIFDWLIK